MNVLIVGGAGYIGSHAAKCFDAHGAKVVCYDNLSRGNAWAVRWGPLVRGELADVERLTHTLREHEIDVVAHLAAFAYARESVAEPERYRQNNVVGTEHLLNAMAAAGTRHIVFSSSCSVYGAPEELPITEAHPLKPVSPYGEGKKSVEEMLAAHAQERSLTWAAIRFFNAAGADPDGEIGEWHQPETHIIPLIIDVALGKRADIAILGDDFATADGTAVRDYVHVNDIANGLWLAAQRLCKAGPSTVVNLGLERGYSIREVIASVERVSGHQVPVRIEARQTGDPPALVANSEKAHDVLGWAPEYTSLDAIIDTAWQWSSNLPSYVDTGTPETV